MKFLKLAVVVVVSMSAVAFAEGKKSAAKSAPSHSFTREYGTAGCGLGSLVVGKSGGQIFASTTNGTVLNQVFAITFGTSNCIDSETAQAAHRMDLFIGANKVAVANDIAKGQGETIKSISAILNCSEGSHLNTALQGKYAVIFPKYDVQTQDVTDSIITVIRNDAELSQSCKIKG